MRISRSRCRFRIVHAFDFYETGEPVSEWPYRGAKECHPPSPRVGVSLAPLVAQMTASVVEKININPRPSSSLTTSRADG